MTKFEFEFENVLSTDWDRWFQAEPTLGVEDIHTLAQALLDLRPHGNISLADYRFGDLVIVQRQTGLDLSVSSTDVQRLRTHMRPILLDRDRNRGMSHAVEAPGELARHPDSTFADIATSLIMIPIVGLAHLYMKVMGRRAKY